MDTLLINEKFFFFSYLNMRFFYPKHDDDDDDMSYQSFLSSELINNVAFKKL